MSNDTKKIQYVIEPDYTVQDPQFCRTLSNLLGPPLLQGNHVTELLNGNQIFPAMLSAIRAAEKTICFETYVYWSGEIGEAFARALAERAGAGVKVHVLLDWLGSKKMKEEYLEEMRKAGAEVERYHPVRWYSPAGFNHRTHRKLLIVDGKIGFTGGVGVADEWQGNADAPDHWRDTHFRVEGPVVAQMQGAFMDNWMRTHERVLHQSEYFPQLDEAGSMPAQMFRSSPREGSESVRLMYLLSIAAAKQRILLESAYFVPDDLAVEYFIAARERGVHIQIITPGGHIDYDVVRRASRARWGPLLDSGVEIYEYQPTMFHCKVMIVDDVWLSVGSTNFDNRSFRLNDEANLNIFDRGLAGRMIEIFESDKLRSRQITLDEWAHRPKKEKFIERSASLLGPQL